MQVAAVGRDILCVQLPTVIAAPTKTSLLSNDCKMSGEIERRIKQVEYGRRLQMDRDPKLLCARQLPTDRLDNVPTPQHACVTQRQTEPGQRQTETEAEAELERVDTKYREKIVYRLSPAQSLPYICMYICPLVLPCMYVHTYA